MEEMTQINKTLENDPYILNTTQKEEALRQIYNTLRLTINVLNGSVVEPGGEEAAKEVSKELQLALFHIDHLLDDYPRVLEIESGEVLVNHSSPISSTTATDETIPF